MSVNTLILIIIGVLILVFLIVGFTIGWKKIFPFVTPGNNVKELSDKCSLACNTNAIYDFCTAKRDVRLDEPLAKVGAKKEFKATCYELTLLKDELGVESCSAVQCTKPYAYSDDFKVLGAERDSKEAAATAPVTTGTTPAK